MADALDRLAVPGEELLRRVDRILARGGVSPESDVAGLLRLVGMLPGEVLEYGLRLDVGSLQEAARELAGVGDRFRVLPAKLSADVDRSGWQGGGAAAFGAVWVALADHIGDGGSADSIVGRIDATADYLDAVVDWAAGLRYELAEAVARVISSAEAVTVVTAGAGGPGAGGEGEAAGAAGRIAERVLRTAVDALDRADTLRREWERRLGELPYRPPEAQTGAAGVTRVTL
ncbi:hypothetical protein Dvina_03205 [Dactylosporangium vinaceum]|uniref:Uncharacterized protein n=1 Tax=Dactylosporangium vinaceum TaxID=53362 RepID=A0ABV5M151_9ACTN|nr:hypothetical protein [Dactylosporangium vinaceum]UAB97219.1 hypothetical protein Dvina_03205 [Dactylosporangium vinaceum]